MRTRRSITRRGFNLVEMLIALSISAALLTATMIALDASFMAYQTTTEVASTHTISRLAMHRMQTLIRSGDNFGPFPLSPTQRVIASDFIQFELPNGDIVELRYDVDIETLFIVTDPDSAFEAEYILLEGVVPQFDADDDRIFPFTLEYEDGRQLHRAVINLTIVPDDNMDVSMDGDNTGSIRLVASAMPRTAAYGN